MTELNRYARGKIYKIVSDNCDEIYIGSTCEPTLARRLAGHVGNYKRYLKENFGFTSSFKILEKGNYSIVLIREYPCETKEQLYAKERHYIEKYKKVCVNKIKGVGTYLEMGHKEYCKKYREEHSDEMKQLKRKYREDNITVIKEKGKKYYQENSDKIKKYKNQKMRCKSCGSIYTRQNKQQHRKTQKHQNSLI
jgi:hypothetical protein